MYIVLEGVVWTWKSTQSKLLFEYFQKKYPSKKVLLVREPGWTIIAEAIRTLVQATDFPEAMDPLTDVYLYAAARAQLIHTKIKETIATWWIVISDRNFCSSLAYQWYAQWLWIQRVWDINNEAVKEVLPDYIFFMDIDVANGLARTFDADGDKWERRNQDFFDKVYAWYEALFNFLPLAWIMNRIDASWTIEEVHTLLIENIQ